MKYEIMIIGILIFILGWKYINYLREYMRIRFGVIECDCKGKGLF